jgi:hypothetical protein
MPSAAYFIWVDEEDVKAVDQGDPGDALHLVTSHYKVSERVPFVLRHVSTASARIAENDQLELAPEKRLNTLQVLKNAWRASRAGLLKPDAHELDELLEYLEYAAPRVLRGDSEQ